jgi:tRNA-dihydrouridine synthase 2
MKFDDEFIAQLPSRFSSGLTIQEKADVLFRDAEILAPMVRASTTPLRALALSYGADLVFTEEMVDRSIMNCHRVLNEELQTVDYVRSTDGYSAKVLRRLKEKDDVPVILRIAPALEKGRLIYQIGSGEGNLALVAAQKVEADVDGKSIIYLFHTIAVLESF